MKITRNRTFRVPVIVAVPDGDAVVKSTFTGHFRALTTDELALHGMETLQDQDAYLTDFLIGWEGLIDDLDGEEKPFVFSPENRSLLISDVFVRAGLIQAYEGAMLGVRRGN
jgi:hypothetical protein